MARRTWGEGSVYRRKDGRVVASVRLADGTRRTTYHRNKEEARASLALLLDERNAGVIGPDPTLGNYLATWLIDVRPTVSHATWKQHEAIVRLHLAPALGRVKLSRLTVAQVRAYLHGSRLHPQTVAHHRATLRRALADAVRDGYVSRNVAAMATPPSVPRDERPWLGVDEVRRLLETTRGDRLHVLWALAATAGLRMAEALGLSWDDLDLDRATLRVVRTLHREDGDWVLKDPKTKGSRRTVPLTELAVDALRAHRIIQLEEQMAAGVPGRKGLVFATPRGAPLHGSNVLPALYRALDAAGLPRVTFHQLRHSAASVMLSAGVPLLTVSRLLGHSTIRITADLYSHVSSDLGREAMDRVQEALTRRMATDLAVNGPRR